MTLTIDSETGIPVTETIEGVTLPVDFSFKNVNDFVHSVDVHFEELQALCLGMACEIERLQKLIK